MNDISRTHGDTDPRHHVHADDNGPGQLDHAHTFPRIITPGPCILTPLAVHHHSGGLSGTVSG
jgi:hypothetical protein